MRRVTITQRQLKPLLEQLARREQDLRARIAEEMRRTDTEDYEQLDGVVGDDADRAFVETAVDIETGRVEQQMKELREIEAARERVVQGTFGICIDCGAAIEYERLRIYTPAVRCAECQTLYEDPGARSRIPKLH
jgi:RNA polymerase-binding transcription factor